MRVRPGVTFAGLVLLLVGCASNEVPLGDGRPDLHLSVAQASAPVAGTSQLVVSIENRGDGADRLVGAETDAALAIEIHRTVIEDDGRAYMRLLDDVVIPAGETVRFRPGGLHLMVVVPDERVRVGGTFRITLRFERSAPVTLDVEVVSLLDLVERDALEDG
jgi:copper(I)-binding protein